MTHQLVVFGTLVLALVLFAWGRLRHDFVALLALFVVVVAGIVEPAAAFAGFGHPAVITVAAVLVIGKALEHSGLVDLLGRGVARLGTSIVLQVLVLSTAVAAASAFMNNVGALAIMLPVALHLARKSGHPPSYLLMPLAFASLLGGMTTLIGTPSNIIVATFRGDRGGEPFGMFDFSPVGVALTLAGLAFLALAGWRLLPRRPAPRSDADLFDIDDYITEVEVTENSRVVGKTVVELVDLARVELQVLGLVRRSRRIHAPGRDHPFEAGDVVIVETDAGQLKALVENTGVRLVGHSGCVECAAGSRDIVVTEAVVMADSPLLGRSVSDVQLRTRHGINLLAVARKESQTHHRLADIAFEIGDVLLLQGRELALQSALPALGCLPLKEVYRSIDWPVIVLLGAMIPVGAALETTGGAARIAGAVTLLGHGVPGSLLLAVLLTLTMLLSAVINNAATVLLMAPIAIGVAEGLGYRIDPFLMAVAVGSSAAFLTPIGHQSNTLVMGPGGYRFIDYARMGLPLTVLVVLLGVPMILWFFPL
ncbi:MAG: SLC13 family permease [Deltaproteobacteria bacterium]|nr:SLC13 family permease [Deltaproteobacteria bacterium]